MTRTGLAIAQAAAGLVDAPYRLHGKDRASGLDCIGLVKMALEQAGFPEFHLPAYRMRGSNPAPFFRLAQNLGLYRVGSEEPRMAGDILVCVPGPAQWHLCIAESPAHFIHAHAGLQKTVRQPFPLPWRLVFGLRTSHGILKD